MLNAMNALIDSSLRPKIHEKHSPIILLDSLEKETVFTPQRILSLLNKYPYLGRGRGPNNKLTHKRTNK